MTLKVFFRLEIEEQNIVWIRFVWTEFGSNIVFHLNKHVDTSPAQLFVKKTVVKSCQISNLPIQVNIAMSQVFT
jgi:hypothetical protein